MIISRDECQNIQATWFKIKLLASRSFWEFSIYKSIATPSLNLVLSNMGRASWKKRWPFPAPEAWSYFFERWAVTKCAVYVYVTWSEQAWFKNSHLHTWKSPWDATDTVEKATPDVNVRSLGCLVKMSHGVRLPLEWGRKRGRRHPKEQSLKKKKKLLS